MSEPINQTFIQKLTGKRRILIFAGILAVAVVHTAMQLSFIQGEKLRSVELTASAPAAPIEEVKLPEFPSETKQDEAAAIVEIKPEEYEVRKVKVITIPERVQQQPVIRRQQQQVVETVQPTVKRRSVRTETKADRLRRAEKILTGV